MKKQRFYILAAAALLPIIFLRVFRLASVPLGLHIDEAGLGLNAWSMANFGTDRYGNFMPVCPSNFYGEQSAFYTCFCALLVRFFGLNMYTLRMPGVIMGILTVIFGALILKEKRGMQGFFTGLILFGIFPYFIMNCRFALDCNAMLGMLTVSLYALVKLMKKIQDRPDGKFYGLFSLVGILFGITLYTYIIAAVVVAVFFILFGLYYLFYRKDGRFLRFRQLLFLALPLWLMAFPLILVVGVNYFDLDPIVTPFFSVPKMITNRTEEVAFSLSGLIPKLKSLTHTLTSDGQYGSSDRYWTMYRWSVAFVAVGGIHSIFRAVKDLKEKVLSIDLAFLFLTFAESLMFLLCGLYNYHINGIFIALGFFCVNGILFLAELIQKRSAKYAFAALVICLYSVSFAGFVKEYFSEDNREAFLLYGGVDQALTLLTDSQRTQKIYIPDEVGEIYFLSNPIPPEEFASFCNELGYIQDYGNLHFYAPEKYNGDEIFICNRNSAWPGIFTDENATGYTYSVLDAGHYLIFYRE